MGSSGSEVGRVGKVSDELMCPTDNLRYSVLFLRGRRNSLNTTHTSTYRHEKGVGEEKKVRGGSCMVVCWGVRALILKVLWPR